MSLCACGFVQLRAVVKAGRVGGGVCLAGCRGGQLENVMWDGPKNQVIQRHM